MVLGQILYVLSKNMIFIIRFFWYWGELQSSVNSHENMIFHAVELFSAESTNEEFCFLLMKVTESSKFSFIIN